MTLTDIKSKLDISTLELNSSTDANGVKTDWFRHWDNENRVAVSIHKELAEELKKNANLSNLGLQFETRTGSKGSYSSYRIVKYAPAEMTL